MNQSYLNVRFDQIDKRLQEVEVLLDFANKNIDNAEKYNALCRSAHVLLVSHLEGLYKDLCRDVIQDINANLKYHQLKKQIFNSFCAYFIQNNDSDQSIKQIRERLKVAFGEQKCELKVDPFLYVDNKNPTPTIITDILKKFGFSSFFEKLEGSRLDIVFKGDRKGIIKLRNELRRYLIKNTYTYPYTIDFSKLSPSLDHGKKDKKKRTFWEEFIDGLLGGRHSIAHGQIHAPQNHSELREAKLKIEILIYSFILALCSCSTPLYLMEEP